MSTALITVWAVEGARPEGLAKEGRTLPAPVHPALLAAAVSHWCNAGVSLQLIGASEATRSAVRRGPLSTSPTESELTTRTPRPGVVAAEDTPQTGNGKDESAAEAAPQK